MPSKRVISGRGVSRTYTLPAHREAYTDDFGGVGNTIRLFSAVVSMQLRLGADTARYNAHPT
jgi:hypothetical protein